MGVFLVLVLIWAAVLLPPALRMHAARQEAFLASIGSVGVDDGPVRPAVLHSLRVQRRRRIAGGLLVAMAATLVVGLLPTFRALLVVHLFLVDSFIAYIGLLAFWAERAARAAVEPAALEAPAPAEEPSRRRWRARVPAPAVLPELAPLA